MFFIDCFTVQSNEITCDSYKCISKSFENDGYVNCPPQQCSDEVKCVHPVQVVEPPISGTNIAISAITSLVLTMVGVLCIWMCCKYKYCRDVGASTSGSSGGTSSNNRRGPSGQRVIDSDFQTIELPSSSENTRPIRASAPEIDDKDVPPSYESLFKKDNTISN